MLDKITVVYSWLVHAAMILVLILRHIIGFITFFLDIIRFHVQDSLWKSLAVNSSNLTYSGLEDFGNENNLDHHNEYADYVLVFMCQSLIQTFTKMLCL